MNDLTYVRVGTDRFRAQVIAEACRASGLVVQLLTSDAEGAGPHLGWAEEHRLLVERGDVDMVKAIIEQSQSDPRSEASID